MDADDSAAGTHHASEDGSGIAGILRSVSPRAMGTLALLALVPAVLFGLGRNLLAGVVTAVNVLLIAASLYLLTTPIAGQGAGDGEHAH